MFKNLFKPKWQSAKPQIRIQALQNLDINDENDMHVIELLAKGDAESEVRLAAIKRIPQREKVITLIRQEKDNGVRHRAIEHLINVLAQNAGDDPVVKNMIKDLDTQALISIIEQTKNLTLGGLALEQLSEETVLEGYALNLPVAQMRQAAAQRLQSEEVLERVIKACKGKDKSVWRICKEKINDLRAEQQQEASIEQQINELCQNIELMSRLPYDNLYAAKLEHLQKQWHRLQHLADNEAVHRFNRAYTLCKSNVDDIHNEQNRQQEEVQRQREALHERMAACEQLEEAVRQLSSSAVLQPGDIPALQALLNTQKIRWEEAASVVEPASDERKRFIRIHGLLQRALDAVRKLAAVEPDIIATANAALDVKEATMGGLHELRKSLNSAVEGLQWPEELAWPDSLKLHQHALDHCERLHQKARALEQEAIDNIRGIFNDLKVEIEQGHLKSANRLLKSASHLVKHLPIKTASNYQKQLRDMTQKVNELRDWQGFVSTPKKEELCREMEVLVDAEMDPQALSNKIRRLQEDWRALGEADKGRNKELWDRFSAAAEKAYEPCRDYFDKLSDVRQHNLAQRKGICDQLQTYLEQYDWENASWKDVSEVYETAKSEWRLYTPVERKEGKHIQDRFNGLLDQLHGKLQEEFNRNRQRREQLIEQVEALAQHEDIAAAIEQTKTLQKDWKDTGLVSRRDDSRLWKRFRAACDRVFERRDQKREAVQKEREQNIVHAEHICEQIEQLAEGDFHDVAAARQEFQQLRQRFEALGYFPKEQIDAIQKRFKDVCARFHQGLSQAQVQLLQASYRELWRRAGLCEELEETLLASAQGDFFGAAPETEWSSEHDVPEAVQSGLQARYDNAIARLKNSEKPTAEELEQNAGALHELCLRLEIVAGVESPLEDQQRRMELQVSRLSSGLQQRGSESLSTADQITQLQLDWCLVGPVAHEQRGPLHQRFQAAMKAAGI